MLYSKKNRLDRRNSIMVAVKKELKAHNAFVSPETLKMLAEALDTSIYYCIEVIRSAEEAAKRLRLVNHEFQHSWAGGYGEKEEASLVSGNVGFGEDYSYEYSDNGNSNGPTEYIKQPEFDVNKSFVVMIYNRDWRDIDGDGCNYDSDSNTIVIYTPETIIDEEAYRISKDAELNEICQLRKSKYNLPKAE